MMRWRWRLLLVALVVSLVAWDASNALASEQVTPTPGNGTISAYCTVGRSSIDNRAGKAFVKCTAPPTLSTYSLIGVSYAVIGTGASCSSSGCNAISDTNRHFELHALAEGLIAEHSSYPGYVEWESNFVNGDFSTMDWWAQAGGLGSFQGSDFTEIHFVYSSDNTPTGTIRRYSVRPNNSAGTCSGGDTCYLTTNRSLSINGSTTSSPYNTGLGVRLDVAELDDLVPPAHWFAGGSDPALITANACTQYSVTTSQDPADVIVGGDIVPLTVTYDGAADPVVMEIQFRPGTLWYSVLTGFEIRTAGENVEEVEITYPPSSEPWTLAASTLRCLREGEAITYVPFGDDGWEGLEPVERACARADLVWPQMLDGADPSAVHEPSDVLSFRVLFTGIPSTVPGADEILSVGYVESDQYATDGVPLYGAASTYSAVTGFSPLEIGGQQGFTITVANLGTSNQLAFRCEDSIGYYYGPQGNWRLPSTGIVPGEVEEACFDSINIGIAPSSWVPGLLSGLSCALETLFVPDEGVLDAFTDQGETLLTERAPLSYVAEVGPVLYSTMADLPDSVEAHDTDCFPAIGGLDEYGFGEESSEICPNEMAGFGALTEWRSVVSIMFWLLAAWYLWRATLNLVRQ